MSAIAKKYMKPLMMNAPILLAASFLCAQDSAPVPQGKAVVYVYRERGVLGMANLDPVSVNGEFVADLGNNEYVRADVPAGNVVVSSGTPHSRALHWSAGTQRQIESGQRQLGVDLPLTAGDGQTYYVRMFPDVSSCRAQHNPVCILNLKLVDKTTGEKR